MIINPIIPVWVMLLFLPMFWMCRSNNKEKFIRQVMIYLLLFIINLRPMIISNKTERISTDLDVLFVIDTTISMIAEDYNGNNIRLSAVKEDCKYIMDKLDGSKFSIISFDDTSKVLIPYTTDKNIIMESLDTINVSNYVYAKGTSLNKPIDSMLKQLQSSSKDSGRARVVFFFSDGEITDNDTLSTSGYASLSSYISDGAVLGYGTEEGGYMYVKDIYKDEYTYLEDNTVYPTTKAVSKIDENNLNAIANGLGIDYINMSKQSNIDSKLDTIKDGVVYKVNKLDKNSYSDIYFFLVIPLLGLLVYEFIIFRRCV